MTFVDRRDAGRRLAARLRHLRDEDVVVLGLPRGGVPVAYEVAQELGAPLDIVLVRKLGVPFQPELAMGALGEGGVRVLHRSTIRRAGVDDAQLRAVQRREQAELQRRAERYRAGHRPIPVAGRTAIVVDDGIATGSTVHAACEVVRARGAARVVIAVPVAPPSALRALGSVADEVQCVVSSSSFGSIGGWYRDFTQTTDDEVLAFLSHTTALRAQDADDPSRDVDVDLSVGEQRLAGRLSSPESAQGGVVLAQGSGTGRHSPRMRSLVQALSRSRLVTLLVDLLTPEEELDEATVQDVETLAARLAAASWWLRERSGIERFGWLTTGTAATAALLAAGAPDAEVAAVVACGGRPDLVADRLTAVRAPTLLVAGDRDHVGLERCREAQLWLRCENRLAVVPGVVEPFEEPGTIRSVADVATEWLAAHLTEAAHTSL